MSAVHEADGSILVPGSFPIHDLPDLSIDVPEGEYTTVAGLILEGLGDLPEAPGASVEVARRKFEVVEVEGLTITRVAYPWAVGRDGPEPVATSSAEARGFRPGLAPARQRFSVTGRGAVRAAPVGRLRLRPLSIR